MASSNGYIHARPCAPKYIFRFWCGAWGKESGWLSIINGFINYAKAHHNWVIIGSHFKAAAWRQMYSNQTLVLLYWIFLHCLFIAHERQIKWKWHPLWKSWCQHTSTSDGMTKSKDSKPFVQTQESCVKPETGPIFFNHHSVSLLRAINIKKTSQQSFKAATGTSAFSSSRSISNFKSNMIIVTISQNRAN
jgi:hypothetical protein